MRRERAQSHGRDSLNFIVYRTKHGEIRDHYVIPDNILKSRLTSSTMTHSEVRIGSRYREGDVSQISVNRYERDPRARARCIEIHGTRCVLCQFDFGKVYGQALADFIHVHHLTPISELGEEYEVDPQTDLRPLCPNCHAVVHKRRPPFSLAEVERMLNRHDAEHVAVQDGESATVLSSPMN